MCPVRTSTRPASIARLRSTGAVARGEVPHAYPPPHPPRVRVDDERREPSCIEQDRVRGLRPDAVEREEFLPDRLEVACAEATEAALRDAHEVRAEGPEPTRLRP